ncbi:hypothetical protein M408DRAFT_18978 [Serendipita vermifera MAFF 305830]|uniref:Uncharacterized protein n=1 Tax=Serendipita vermifera MAFF 305830 TaxID=933852 RepID=A0A0C3A5J1_SERVB|nr:hypothetical protein M408DRAFT_30790 [Serendipita vermifera MAFF 305830]KIM34014.1 hypothetical protein M408DRAFT_18978 [Serendipita vermifera MAFF 305830]
MITIKGQYHNPENTQNIAPGNTLQANRRSTGSVNPSATAYTQENGHAIESQQEAEELQPEPSSAHPSPPSTTTEIEPEAPRKVHFHGRVRITSGVGHGGRGKSDWIRKEGSQASLEDGNGAGHVSPIDMPPRRDPTNQDSSTSASYSSSISAPLRSSTELPPRPTSVRVSSKRRKPLSNVLGSQEADTWLHTLAEQRRERKMKRMAQAMDERSPLLTQAQRSGMTNANNQNAHTARETDGQPVEDDWPWKLLTLTYWESQLSALCCCETDSED